MIHVIATIELAPGTRDAFLRAFHEVMPLVKAEDGCIEYGPAIDIKINLAVQVPFRENTVTVVEKWSTVDALQAHLSAPHMIDYRTKVKDFVRHVTLQVLQPV